MLTDAELRALLDLHKQAQRELETTATRVYWMNWTTLIQQHGGPLCEELLALRSLLRNILKSDISNVEAQQDLKECVTEALERQEKTDE